MVVINTKDVAVEADYWRRWRHYNYKMGFVFFKPWFCLCKILDFPFFFSSSKRDSETPIFEVHEKDPTAVSVFGR